MSIQTNSYTSKKTGKTKTQYYASVWYAAEKRSIVGPMRESKKLARQDETDIQREIDAGKPKPKKKLASITLNDVYIEWHEATSPPGGYANNTWQVYARFYRSYIQETFGDKEPGKIEPIHIQRFKNIIKKKYSPETVNKILNILSDMFSFAIDPLKCTTQNPVSGISRCKVPRTTKTTWSDDTISYFLELPEVKSSDYYPMLCLSALLGPRPGEVCGLRESALMDKPTYCINFDRGYDNFGCETDLKTRESHRTPPIPKYLYDIIRRRLLWKKEKHLADKEWGDNDYLFVNQNGVPVKPDQYGKALKRLIQAHNASVEQYKEEHGKLPPGKQLLPYISIYGFRTSFATNNMRRWPNAALISSIMGNSPKTLLQFYAQSDIEMQLQLINGYSNSTSIQQPDSSLASR